ncbi:DUF3953 domain-containing protein [Halobacillus litoralis]|uniref:DUF3953 domain-containing protein n=1 Tax=Halobacillus litoralis TaxID=45668 RepID=A0A410M9C3_9BACI|nr:DUF3953 domain-containing protein [Halobacillus litoralis]QAS51312.1 hypothetical protein HLI_03330 [Halobacillus litoralis]
MKVIRVVSAIIAFSIMIYSIRTDNYQILYFTQLFIGTILLIYSISEFQHKRKARAVLLLFLAGLTLLMGTLSLSS